MRQRIQFIFAGLTLVLLFLLPREASADVQLYLHHMTFHNGVTVDRLTTLSSEQLKSKLRDYVKTISTLHHVTLKEADLIKAIGFPLYYHLKLHNAFKIWRDEEFMAWQSAQQQPPIKTIPRSFSEDRPSLAFIKRAALGASAKQKKHPKETRSAQIPALLDTPQSKHISPPKEVIVRPAIVSTAAEKRRLNLENLSSLVNMRRLRETLHAVFQDVRTALKPLSTPGKTNEPVFISSRTAVEENPPHPDLSPLIAEIIGDYFNRNRYVVVQQKELQTGLNQTLLPNQAMASDSELILLRDRFHVRFVLSLSWDITDQSILILTEVFDIQDRLVRHHETYQLPLFDTI